MRCVNFSSKANASILRDYMLFSAPSTVISAIVIFPWFRRVILQLTPEHESWSEVGWVVRFPDNFYSLISLISPESHKELKEWIIHLSTSHSIFHFNLAYAPSSFSSPLFASLTFTVLPSASSRIRVSHSAQSLSNIPVGSCICPIGQRLPSKTSGQCSVSQRQVQPQVQVKE